MKATKQNKILKREHSPGLRMTLCPCASSASLLYQVLAFQSPGKIALRVLLVSYYSWGLSKKWFHINLYFRGCAINCWAACLNLTGNGVKWARFVKKNLFYISAQGKRSLPVQMSRVNICARILKVWKELFQISCFSFPKAFASQEMLQIGYL